MPLAIAPSNRAPAWRAWFLRTRSTARAAKKPEVSRPAVMAQPVELSSSARPSMNISGLSHWVKLKPRMNRVKAVSSARMKIHTARSPVRRARGWPLAAGLVFTEVDIDYIHQRTNGLQVVRQRLGQAGQAGLTYRDTGLDQAGGKNQQAG